MNRLGITQKLTFVFILFAGLMLVGLSIPAYIGSRAALQAATISNLLTTALEKQAALDAWVNERQHIISDIANQAHFREAVAALLAAPPGSSDASRAHATLVADLGNWAGEGRQFLFLEVIDAATARVSAATQASEEGKFREEQAYFINGLQAATVQNPYYDLSRQQPSMTAAAPLLAPDGRLVAVLAGALNMDEMNAIVRRRSGLHQTDDTFLVDTSNLFVTQPRLISDPVVLHGIHTEAANRCLAHNSGVIAYADYRGVPAIIVYRWLPERQLCLITKIDQAEAFAAARALGSTMALTGGLVLLVGAVVAFGISRTITRPVRQLVLGAEQIGQGNLDYRIEIKSGDEVGKLGLAFNEMAANLQRSLQQLESELAERKRTEAALRESEERFRGLSEAAFEAIIVHDGGLLLSANSQYAAMFGYEPQELLGKQVMALTIAPDAVETVKKEIATGGVGPYESTGLRKDGSRFPMEIRVREMEYKGGKVRVAAIRDITESKRAEQSLRQRSAQLEAANQELEAFAYSVSHDLRAPLRALDGFSAILLNSYPDNLDEQGRHYLDRIRAASQRMGQLIEDLLGLSRITRAALNRQPVDLSALAQEVAAELQKRDPQRQAEFIIAPQMTAEADPHLLRILLQNLLDNAWKFTSKREAARIEVGYRPMADFRSQNADWATDLPPSAFYFVRDNGAGFDMTYADKLFTPFQRLHSTQEFPGTGIGLATVQRIAARHGGRAWAEAQVDQGATFYFTLGGS